ncbi:hypothetical protein BO85DRAFT_494416 [Aspergillus piperis CBS 112811]|uniref:Uncharacterized protein n=1 Tax=Aspergillus piperis CBS 112811 TaxID=1448313 RepID=A0A8G1RA76_9EURO|nr:hypothetical protein BO85DRAFT_494416 [Aspergillus piperis CBS 112811]RAH62921.1 hypothetical protein BO85DRAFT_494416 [Aspergillus piperis CBS 112811]
MLDITAYPRKMDLPVQPLCNRARYSAFMYVDGEKKLLCSQVTNGRCLLRRRRRRKKKSLLLLSYQTRGGGYSNKPDMQVSLIETNLLRQ